jgi:hypothetical protein
MKDRFVNLITYERLCSVSQNDISYFWKQVDTGNTEVCWLWQGYKTNKGYGQLYLNGKALSSHIFSLFHHQRPTDLNLLCLHSCDVRACCNPHHLRWGTSSDNMQDMVSRNALHRATIVDRFSILGRKYGGANKKLSPEDVQTIRLRYSSGVRSGLLASEYSVNKQTILNIVAFKTYC